MKRWTFITCLKTTLFTKKPKNMYRSYEYNNFWHYCYFQFSMASLHVLHCHGLCVPWSVTLMHVWILHVCDFSHFTPNLQLPTWKILHIPSSETKGTKNSLSDTYCSVLLLLPRCTWCAIGELSTQAMVCSCYLHYN